MNVLVEIFFPSGACHCTTKVFKEQIERIAAAIKEKYSAELEVVYLPVHTKRARELGIYEANTVAINEKPVLKGYYTAEDLRKKIVEVVSGGK
ncbi:MAG: hypothetical protein ABH874_04230 [Methanobacteriota archaeon]